MSKLLTVREASEVTGLTEKAIRRRIEKGQVESVNRDGQRLVIRQSLVEAGLVAEGGGEVAPSGGKSQPKPIAAAADTATLLAALPEVAKLGEELGRYKALTESTESANAELREVVASQRTELDAAIQREAELKAKVEALESEANRGGLFRRRRGRTS